MALKHIDTSKTGYKPQETPYQKLMREAQEAQAKERANAYQTATTRQTIGKEQAAALAESEARSKAVQQAQNTSTTNAYKQLRATPTPSGKPALATPSVRKQNEQAADLAEMRSQQNTFVPKPVQPQAKVSKTADARKSAPDIRGIPAEVAQLTSGVAQQAGASLGVFADTTARAGGWRPVNEIGQTDAKNTPAMKSFAEASKKIEQVANQYKGAPKVAIDVTTSMGRNLLTLAASAVNPAVGMSIMGAMAAGDKAYELRMQDIGTNEALMRGLVSGIIEGATEAIPFSKLANIAKTGGNGFIRNLAEQVFTEATEEAVAYTANYIADKAANDPNAIFSVKDLAYSAALGGISGGIFGAGGTLVNNVANVANRQTPQIPQQNGNTLPSPAPQVDNQTQQLPTAKPIEQVAQEVVTRPAEAANDPTTAAAIIDPANVEYILSELQKVEGDKAFETAQTIIASAKQTVKATTAQQASAQPTTTQTAGTNSTPTERTADSVKTALEYVERSSLTAEQKQAYSAVVNNSRYNIQFDYTLPDDIDGYNDGTTVYINPKSDKGIDYVITHEIGHYGESGEMIDYALQALKDIGYADGDTTTPATDETINTMLSNIKAEREALGKPVDDNGARAELAMTYYGELLKGDTKTIQRLAAEKPTVFQRIREAVEDLIIRFKGTAQEKQLVELRKKFVEAVRTGEGAGQTRYSVSAQESNAANSNTYTVSLTPGKTDRWTITMGDGSVLSQQLYGETLYIARDSAPRYMEAYFDITGAKDITPEPKYQKAQSKTIKKDAMYNAVVNFDFDNGYNRYYQSKKGTVMGDNGIAMFAQGKAFLRERGSQFGDRVALYDGKDGVQIEELREYIKAAWKQEQETYFDNYPEVLGMSGTEHYMSIDGDTIADGFNPADIVNSADNWDDMVLPQWFYNKIIEPKGIKAVLTNDGAIVYSPSVLTVTGIKPAYSLSDYAGDFEDYRTKDTRANDIRYSTGSRLASLAQKRETVTTTKTERSAAVAEIRNAVDNGTAENTDINRLIVAERDVANAQKELALAEQRLLTDERADSAAVNADQRVYNVRQEYADKTERIKYTQFWKDAIEREESRAAETERRTAERVSADQRVYDAKQEATERAERKRYVQYWKDELNKAETQLNIQWQVAKEKHKGDAKLQKALDHFKEVQERDKARRAERAERVNLLESINGAIKADRTGYINRLMRDAFQGMDTKATSLNLSGAVANPNRMDMIQVNDLSMDDVGKLTNILKDIDKQIAEQAKDGGIAKPGDIYRDAAAKIKELLEPYQKVEIEPADNEITKTAKALANSKIEKKTVLQQTKSAADVVYRKLMDTGNAIAQIGKIAQDRILYTLYNNAKQGKQAAEYNLMQAQTNARGEVVGDSLVEIFEPIRKRGDEYYNAFQTYMYHRHNIARMEQGKPVFNDATTADVGNKAIAEAEAINPDFVSYAKKVYKFLDNLMQYRVDTGLISAEQAQAMRAEYPFYVPTFRIDGGGGGSAGAKAGGRSVSIAQTVKTAEGSDADLMPLHESIARQAMQTIQAGKRNVFANRLLFDTIQHKEKLGDYVQEVMPTTQLLEIDAPNEKMPDAPNTILFYVNGKGVQLKLSDGVFEGLQAISTNQKSAEDNAVLRMFAIMPNNAFKKLITAYNPIFLVRNAVRDIQDVGLYSKDLSEFGKQYFKAIAQIKSNGKLWQQYQAMGGFGSSIFDYQTGYDPAKVNRNKTQKALDAIENANFVVEQLPRFTEFMATVAKGGTGYNNLMQAMYNAADVTVNFGRSGTWGKTLNSTFVPFFNPAVQGFDKTIRTFTQQPSARAFTILVIKAAVMGIAPALLSELLYKDDEDYGKLRDRDKDLNYLLKIGDGLFIKIPKGRVLSVIGAAATMPGKIKADGADAWAGLLQTAIDQIAPVSPIEGNILAQAYNAKYNRTWWGGEIEPQRLQNLPAGERYDEATDYFSKWLGGVLHYSPKKINYLLDSYTGVIGDFALPLMTPRAEQNPFARAFTIDSTLSNKISASFYDTKQKLTEQGNSEKTSPLMQAQISLAERYFNAQAKAVSDLNKQIREIENSNISDKDKREEVREIKATIAGIQQNTLEALPKYQAAVAKRLTTGEEKAIERAYLLANKDTFGAQYAIEKYNKNTYAKAEAAAQNGISYSKYFDMFLLNTPDADGNGSISQDEMRVALDKTALSKSQKAFLFSQQNKDWKNNPYRG